MFKYTLAFAVALAASASFANTTAPTEKTAELNSVRNLPVIILSEIIAEGKCRLHFEGGSTLDISCDTTNKEIPKAIASI